MDFHRNLVFCNDGILRIEFHKNNEPIFYPLIELQKLLDNDPTFILNFFDKDVFIESGTTLGNIILSLEPWADIFHKFIDRDIQAYCDAYKKQSNKIQSYDYIEITKFVDISREYEYDRIRKDESLSEYLSRPTINKKPSDFFKVLDEMSVCGFKKNDPNNYSVSIEFETICNIPVFLVNKQENIFLNDENENILNSNIANIIKNNKSSKFYSKASYSLMDLIKAIFVYGVFYYTPVTKEKEDALIQSLNEAAEKFKKSQKEDLNKIESENTPDLKINVMPGAFDAIYNAEEKRKQDAKILFEKLGNLPNIKIGDLLISQKDISSYKTK